MIFCGLEDLGDKLDNQDKNAEDEVFGRALFAAAYKGNERATSMLLELGADVDATGGVFHSVLQLASSKGLSSMVKLLLEAGANVNDEGGQYGTALLAAVACNHKPALEFLLAHGASPHLAPEISGQEGRSPLLVTAERGHLGIADRLLEIEDIDVNFRTSELRTTPLWQALNKGHVPIAERLAFDSRIDKTGCFPRCGRLWKSQNCAVLGRTERCESRFGP
jgi:ankyrin repeat protein